MKALVEIKESRRVGRPIGAGRLTAPRAVLYVELERKRKSAPPRQRGVRDPSRETGEIVGLPTAFDFGRIATEPPATSETPPAQAADVTAPFAPQSVEEGKAPPTDDAGEAKEGAPSGAEGKEIIRAPAAPSEDPAFQEAKGQVRTEAKKQKRHAPPEHKRLEAEKASALPEDEQKDQSAKEESTAEMEQVAKQQEQEQKRSSEAFKRDLKQRIADQMEKRRPKSESSAKELAKEPVQFEPEFSNKVDAEQGKIIGPLRKEADPNPTGGVVEKIEEPIPDPIHPSAPKPVDPKLVIPKPRTDEEISQQHESDRLDEAMRENRLSDEQLAESREHPFIETLKVKQNAQQKAAEVPAEYRQREEEVLSGVETAANESTSAKLEGMGKTRRRSGGAVHEAQRNTETTTEKRQKEIKKTRDGFYNQTVIDVEKILADMTKKVKEDFAESLEQKTNAFNEAVRSSISKYYGDWRIDDELFGPSPVVVKEDGSTRSLTSEEIRDMMFKGKKIEVINPDVYRIFLKEKNNFIEAMNNAIDKVADEVEKGLTAAHRRIEKGESDIAGIKNTLKGHEWTYAMQLEEEAKLKFDNLRSSIDDAREDLLQTLADQYVENVDQLEKTFKEINDDLKKGWIERAIELIKTIGKTIFELAELLFTILVRVAYLVWDIIKHPIRFFETLVSGLMQGISNFIENIGTYLEEAFWTWLTGASPVKNIRLSPGSGVDGLFDLVLQVLNFGPADLRAIVEKILGKEFMQMVDQGVAFAEKALEPVTILLTKGPLAFWEYVKETLAGTIQSSFDRIKETVFYGFIEKGLKWIAGFFVPGGGFVKIVKAIFSAFQFVAENLENIRHFFDSIFDSMEAAVRGETEGVASRIITGLKLGVVLALDFLAKLLGLNKIVDSVQMIIQSLRRPIVRAIEWVLHKVKPFVMKLMRAGKKLLEKGKEKVEGAVAALLEWLHFRTGFKSRDGGDHQIFFRGSKQNPVLMVASNGPKPVEEFLKARKASDPSAQNAFNYYVNTIKIQEDTVQEKEKLYRDAMDKGAKRKARYQHQVEVQTLRNYMKDFSDLLGKVKFEEGEGAVTIRTEITKKPDRNRAAVVKASPLTYLPGKYVGGPPSEDPPGWKDYAQDASDKWVRGHLLSEQLHGPGLKWNLVPVSQSVNSQMETVESTVKPLIAKQGKLYHYTATATYDDNRTDENERSIPTAVSVIWGSLDDKKKTHPEGPFRQSLPTLAGPPNLNTVGWKTLYEKGISNGRLARDIVRCRDSFIETAGSFDDYRDLIDKLQKYYANMLTPKSGPHPDKWLGELTPDRITILSKAIVVDKTLEIK